MTDWFEVELRHDGALNEELPTVEEQAAMDAKAEMVALDKPEQIQAFAELQLYYALKLETTTGLRHSRGSVMNLVRERYGIPYRTKKKVLAELRTQLLERGILSGKDSVVP
jgi:hypothetical protein